MLLLYTCSSNCLSKHVTMSLTAEPEAQPVHRSAPLAACCSEAQAASVLERGDHAH